LGSDFGVARICLLLVCFRSLWCFDGGLAMNPAM
jgi:hypothetical protein